MRSVALKRVVRVVAGQSPPSDEVSALDGTGLAFLQGNAEFGMIHPRPKHRCDSAPKRALAGDILLSVRAPVGALNIADRDYGIGRGLAAIRPGGVESRFAWWSLHVAIDELRSLATGSTFEAITADDIGSLRIRVPTLSQQREIADFLDAETVRIDALIEKKRRMSAVMYERSFALLSEVLIPAGCTLTRLGRFASVQTGLTVDGSRADGHDVVTRPYLRVANVLHGRLALDIVTEINVSRALAERTTLRTGDVLMTEGGDLDKLGRGTVWRDEVPGCLHQNHVFAVRTDPTRLDGEYLALLTQTAHGRAYFERTGSRITNLASTSSAKVLDFPVPVLPLAQQRSLVDAASDARAFSTGVSSRLTKQIDLLREHRQALITAAVTGKLDVAKAAA